MNLPYKQINISAYQVAVILLISRCQTFMISISFRKIFDYKTSDIFISMLIGSFISFFLILPSFCLMKKTSFDNIITCAKKISKPIGNILAAILSIYFLTIAIVHVASTNFFMSSRIYVHSSIYLILILTITVIYAIFLGIESIFRSGFIIFCIFVLLFISIAILLIPQFKSYNIQPFNFDNPLTILSNSKYFLFYSEIITMIVFMEYSKQKSHKVFIYFLSIIFIMGTIFVITCILCMGHYIDTIVFPVYTVTSFINFPIVEKLDSLYIVFDTMLSFIKTCIYIFLSIKCAKSLIGHKFNNSLNIIFCLITSAFAIFLVSNTQILKNLNSLLNSYIIILLISVFFPLILLIIYKFKNYKSSATIKSI